MRIRQRAGRGALWALGVLGTVAGLACQQGGTSTQPSARSSREGSDRVGPLAQGRPEALEALSSRITPQPDAPAGAFTESEAADAVSAMEDLRTGFARLAPEGRTKALGVAGRVLARFAVDLAPACWSRVLGPSHALLTAGLADADPGVRASAMGEVGRLWSWMPGRTPLGAEEQAVDAWKQGLVAPCVRRLADPEPASRAAAVACLARLPIAEEAARAVAYIADPDASVRQQALVGFAARRDLLSEETILTLLYDPSPAVALVADRVLKARGLTGEQIGLGRMVYHPRADLRSSAIPLLLPRTDIDPVVWLIHLSHDADESVRAKAAEALATRPTPESRRRLGEMAKSDGSPRVRSAAAQALPAPESTVALPPLPGSPGLNPRAN